ncbi:hypothetical protein GCM10023324_25120 [Streptomyces youssoufiensis]
MAAARPPRRTQPAAQAAQETQRVEEAARICLDVIERGGTAVIAERASTYVSDETWQTLVKRHHRRGCDPLARLARDILNGKDLLHEAVGRAVGGFFGLIGRPRIERVFAQEVARRVPLPFDAKLSAAARGLQIAGIYTCVVGNRDLTDCACLRDVIRVEGQERLQRLIHGAMGDWQSLPRQMRDGVTGL